MRRLIMMLMCISIFSGLKAQYNGYTAVNDTEKFRVPFAAASQKTNTIKSDFVQEKTLSLLSEKIISEGKFWFKKEDKVRMEYEKPYEYLMIINGDNVLVKESEKVNRMSAKSNKLFQQVNRIMMDCVRGNLFNNADYKTRVFENNQGYLVEMVPVSKALKDLFSAINVSIDKKNYSVTRITMIERSADQTEIKFVNKELNATIPDALFAVK